MKTNLIPFLDGYCISKNGDIFKVEKGEEPERIETVWKKYLYAEIEKHLYRVDDLICRTYYGPIGFPIEYKDKNEKNCCFDNLRYEITSVDIIDGYLFLNNIPIPFKEIPGTNKIYISPNGVVYSYYEMKIKPISHRENDYCSTSVYAYGKSKTYYLHRITYITWVGEIEDKYVIDHLDGRKWNNDICNLEMVTSGENNQRAFSTGLKDLKWSKEIIHVICRMMEKNYSIQDIYNILGLPEERKEDRFNVTMLVSDIKTKGLHQDVSSQYDLSNYDVKKNHYTKIGNDGRQEIIENLLLNTDLSQYKIADIVNISRGTVEYVKHKLRKQGLVA